MAYNQKNIRNFSIIAHIDHGKSTLADRILALTGAVSEREAKNQFLDTMDIERERGITVKAQTVSLEYKAKNGETYQLNLIDTPGHVDFSYEVSRALASCEGALLVVDAAQGVEAQTLANVYMAIENNLEILPVLNKVDLPAAEPERVKEEIEHVIGIDMQDTLLISAKSGLGVDELLERIIEKIPAPTQSKDLPLQALIFDSWFDSYVGIVVLFRVVSGSIYANDTVSFMQTDKSYQITELGKFTPFKTLCDELHAGEVGFLSASIKNIGDVKIGDTITLQANPADSALQGYSEANPMVFSGVYPVNTEEFTELKVALNKLALNDSSITFEAETSVALGFGFRCGFLGLLHMEIIQERLEREFDLNLLITSPTVVYRVYLHDGTSLYMENPAQMPEVMKIDYIEEPYVSATILVPAQYVGAIMKLSIESRAVQKDMDYITADRVALRYEIPLNEIVFNFFDRLKSLTKGYASFEYELLDYRKADLVKLDILLNGDIVDALSIITHKDKAYFRGRELVKQLKTLLPKQMFEIAVQASIGNKVIARETVSALRKNVTAKCYGGDISRKRKLLERQKKGKKRMKQFGNVEVPQEAFLAVLKITE